jgi:prolyl-tRNA synthetase
MMFQSQLFTKTRREAPKDEVSKNAGLLIRAGFIHKEMAGVYAYLPLGLRVLRKIENIIRDEMNNIGGQELFLTALQDKTLWEKTGRFDDSVVDDWFKTKLKNGSELGLGLTHEEPLTNLLKDHVNSYRDLPLYIYQIQTKFRNEMRAKSGLIRCREFLMKDLYSFSRSEEEHNIFYEEIRKSYFKILERLGIGDITFLTSASGGIFSKFSHEFQTISPAGEDTIYVDEKRKIAVNKEVMSDEVLHDLGLKRDELVEKKSIEVGNIFNLGTRFSKPLGLTFPDEKGRRSAVIMGSYGLGPTRLMGTIAEVLSDDKGLVWPESAAPFNVHLIVLNTESQKRSAAGPVGIHEHAGKLYEELWKNGVEALYDDRDMNAGEKFADSEVIGIPYRVIISAKTLASECVELAERKTGKVKLIKINKLLSSVKN